MSATFRVQDGFHLESRQAYVLRGEVLAGVVRPGMFISVPLNGSVAVTAPISSVEAVDGPSGASAVGLVLRCEDEVERAVWAGLTSHGEKLTVGARDPAA